MMKKLFKKIRSFFEYLVYGLKYTEDQALTQAPLSNGDNVGVYKEIQDHRVAKHLKQGEVTQEVKELRYRDYKIFRESKNYKYDGNGTAHKITTTEQDVSKKVFKQENSMVVNGILDEFNRMGETTLETYTLTVICEDVPRFKLEAHCCQFDVSIPKKTISLHFVKFADERNNKHRQFINELDKLISLEDLNKKYNILTNVLGFSFVTYKAVGEDDLVRYLIKDLSIKKCIKNDTEYVVTFRFKSYEREDLLEKFYCKEMDKKYKTKAPKKLNDEVVDLNAEYRCSNCGRVMNKIDYSITKGTFGYPLCENCLKDVDNWMEE